MAEDSIAGALVRRLARSEGAGSREAHLLRAEEERVRGVLVRREYYEGSQFDGVNADAAAAEGCKSVLELPEHLKKHAYSTQIQESVDFLASELTKEFQIQASSEEVHAVLMGALEASPDLSAGADEGDMSITNTIRDALTAGDVPVHVRWDPVEGTPWFEFWESESVEFRFNEQNRHRLEQVIVTELVWQTVGLEDGQRMQTTTYEMLAGECVRTVQVESDEPEPPEYLGLPFIPWCLIRASKKRVRSTRGESIITGQAIASADRYNANEQQSYLIGRYNSHGNLVIVGDAAVMMSNERKSVSKDVADVLTFPGGTEAKVITLPTDPQMIEHQRTVLLDSLYGCFGLARLDTTTVQGMGQVSGYALEILNRRTESTFSQIRKQVTRDLREMLNMALDVQAYKATEEDDLNDVIGGLSTEESTDGGLVVDMEDLAIATLVRMNQIDPEDVFPDRKITIQLSSGYIVDDVMIRDDFVAGLISLEEALRQRGKSDPEIKQIIREIDKRKPKQPEVALTEVALNAATRPEATPPETAAGSTLNQAGPDERDVP